MTLENVVQDWCEVNKHATGGPKWRTPFMYATCAGTLLLLWLSSVPLLIASIIVLVGWAATAPPKISVKHLRSDKGRALFVPDSLLSAIADSREIDESVKTALADVLARLGAIQFHHLFAIEDKHTQKAHHQVVPVGDGFKKLIAYRQVRGLDGHGSTF